MPAIGGAAQLGRAQGEIAIDTSSLRSISGVVRSVATDVGRAFGAIDVSAKRVEANILRVSRGIGQMRGELAGLGIGAGIIAGLGVKTAANFQESAIKLAGMTGSVANATKLMEDLRKKAFAAGLPFQDMLATAERLLPTFQGNTKELDRWYNIVRRVAVLNPTEGMTGAAFSINEAIVSGGTDMVSLVERFNISRVKLREELAKNGGDMHQALSTVLTTMGITDETAQKMGQTFNASFRVAKDAALQLLAEGFTPLMNMLTPILQGTAQWVVKLREASPALVGIGAGMVTITALGAPTLLLFNQLVEAGQKLKALGLLGGLGRVGVAGLMVGAGVAGGISATNLIGNATGNKSQQEFGVEAAWLRLRQAIVILVAGVAEITQTITGVLINSLRYLVNAVVSAASAIGGVVSAIGGMLPGAMGGNALSQMGGVMTAGGGRLQQENNKMFDGMIAGLNKRTISMMSGFSNFMVAPGEAASSPAGGGSGSGSSGGPNTGDRDKAISVWAQSAARIEREAGKARLDATRQYEQQRSEAIANYELGIARDAEDFARQRQRAATQLARQIADIQADAAKREADWQSDLVERVAEIRSDGNERLTELEANYNRDRERSARDHRDRLMTAAARLDAVAVAEEMRNYSRQQQDAAQAFQTQQDKLREDLAERLAQEHENQQERLRAARAADQERIADLIQSQAEQQALEDEDREIQRQRREEDQARQLEQMDTAHAERLSQIAQQAAEERSALNESFVQELNQLGIHRDAWLDLQKKQQDLALKQFQTFWSQFNQQFPNRPGSYQDVPTPFPGNLGQFPTSFADFNLGATRTGAASAASGGSVSNRSINVAEGAIVINAAPNHDEGAIGRQVDYHLRKILEEAAG
jgi:hypothetical protein